VVTCQFISRAQIPQSTCLYHWYCMVRKRGPCGKTDSMRIQSFHIWSRCPTDCWFGLVVMHCSSIVVRKACTRRPNYRVTNVPPSRLSLCKQKCLQWLTEFAKLKVWPSQFWRQAVPDPGAGSGENWSQSRLALVSISIVTLHQSQLVAGWPLRTGKLPWRRSRLPAWVIPLWNHGMAEELV